MLQPRREKIFLASPETQRVYVYGIMRAREGGTEPNLPPLKGLEDNPVHTIVGDGLAALSSRGSHTTISPGPRLAQA